MKAFLDIALAVNRPVDGETVSGGPSGLLGAGLLGGNKGAKRSEWPKIRAEVLRRDDFSCQFCGFRSERYQKVIPLPGSKAILRADKLVTACIFCEQCFDIESVGQHNAGVLLWLPEITQAQLHHIARAIYVARIADETAQSKAVRDAATTAFDQLLSRRSECKRRLGTDDPLVLASVLQEGLDDSQYVERKAKLEGVRLMPLPKRMVRSKEGESDQFPEIISYYASLEGAYAAYPFDSWAEALNTAA